MNLLSLFQQGKYRELLDEAAAQEINAQGDQLGAMLVAASLLELGRYEQALAQCRQLTPALGERLDFLKLYASTLRRCGHLEEALQIYQANLSRFPDDLSFHNNYANLLIDLGRLAEAEDILRLILSRDPAYTDARQNLSRLKDQEAESSSKPQDPVGDGQHQDSERTDQENIINIDPLELAFAEDEVIEDQKTREIARKTKAISKGIPPLPSLESQEMGPELISASREAVSNGCLELSLDLVREVLLHHEDQRPEGYSVLSDLYIKTRNYPAAEIALLTAQELGHEDQASLINLVTFAIVRGDASLARRRLVKAVEFGVLEQRLITLKDQIHAIGDDQINISLSGLCK